MMRVKRERGESSRRNDRRGGGDTQSMGGAPTPSQSMGGAPQRSESDRQHLRSRYRELRMQVNDRKGELAQADFQDFQAIVEKAERLHRHGLKPREQLSDAELLMDITSEILDVAKGAQVKGGMSAPEFVGAIIRAYSPGSVNGDSNQPIHWEALGLDACLVLRQAPGISTMVGPMDVELKGRKSTTRGRREKPTERTRPQIVGEADPNRPSVETEENVKTMFGILIQHQEVRLDALVLNRNSFAQTIENIFALSFLVKDGHVRYNVSEGGIQTLAPCEPLSHEERTERNIRNFQFVFRTDFECWRLMQEQVPPGAELMPHRGVRQEATESLPKARTPIRKNSRNRARETPAVSPPGESPTDASGSGSGSGASRFKKRLVLP